MNEFAAFWNKHYPSAHPVGWMMRSVRTEPWLRFHSLPLSKQYADTDEERAIILDRQNQLAGDVLGEDGSVWFVQTHWAASEGSIDFAHKTSMFQETREYPLPSAYSFDRDEGDDEFSSWEVFAARAIWKKGYFDRTLLRIADEKAGPTLWVSATSGAVFAPYDGGIDLFLASEEQSQTLRSKYVGWLPTNTAGL